MKIGLTDVNEAGPGPVGERLVGGLEKVLQRLGKQRSLALTLLGGLAIACIGVLDSLAGHDSAFPRFT